MQTVVEQEFASNPLSYLRAVEGGACVLVSDGHHPVAIILPMASLRERKFGAFKGEFSVPDDFNAPLPEVVLRAFEANL